MWAKTLPTNNTTKTEIKADKYSLQKFPHNVHHHVWMLSLQNMPSAYSFKKKIFLKVGSLHGVWNVSAACKIGPNTLTKPVRLR